MAVLEPNTPPPCVVVVDPNKPPVWGAEDVVVEPKRPVVGLLACALPNIPPPAAGVVLDPLDITCQKTSLSARSFHFDAVLRTRMTTHNSELAELVFMLKPPGPLMDRANAMIHHAVLRQMSK